MRDLLLMAAAGGGAIGFAFALAWALSPVIFGW